jgi:hypothetical protein
MTIQVARNLKYPACQRIQAVQDVLLVSSFAIWAAMLGLAPVLAYRMLIGA